MLENEYILLKTVKNNGSLLPLQSRGLTVAQIATMIEQQVRAGMLVAEADGLFLTPLGNDALSKYMEDRAISMKDSWIFPQQQFYKKPLKEGTIVLPKKKL